MAEEISLWVISRNLNNPYGGDIHKGNSQSGKRYYSVTFSYPRAIDGTVDVYGPNFIMVKFVFRGRKDSFIAKSADEFFELMDDKFGLFIND